MDINERYLSNIYKNCGEVMKVTEIIVSYLKHKWWYLILLILSTIYVLHNKSDIYQLKEFNAMNLIFILWLILLILPLFSEIEFFGIKLKKEVEKAKAEVKENLNELRMQIMDLKISNSNANTINIGNDFLPPEQKIIEMAKKFVSNSNKIDNNIQRKKVKYKADMSKGDTASSAIDLEIAEGTMYLFKVRLMLEKYLTDLCDKTNYVGNKSFTQMLRHLEQFDILKSNTIDLINQIIKIANRGVHGEIVSNEYIDFIKQVLPELQKQLYEVNNQLCYCICPRCRYNGYSRFENVCPRCGFVSDES